MKKIFSWLPIASLVDYSSKFEAEERENPKWAMAKVMGHIAYAGVAITSLMFYSGACYDSGSFNPVNHAKIYGQKYKDFKNQQKSYDYDWKLVFGESGLADKDNNGLSKDEKEDVYRQMGLEKVHGKYPKPSFEDLEKCIEEAQNGNDSIN